MLHGGKEGPYSCLAAYSCYSRICQLPPPPESWPIPTSRGTCARRCAESRCRTPSPPLPCPSFLTEVNLTFKQCFVSLTSQPCSRDPIVNSYVNVNRCVRQSLQGPGPREPAELTDVFPDLAEGHFRNLARFQKKLGSNLFCAFYSLKLPPTSSNNQMMLQVTMPFPCRCRDGLLACGDIC